MLEKKPIALNSGYQLIRCDVDSIKLINQFPNISLSAIWKNFSFLNKTLFSILENDKTFIQINKTKYRTSLN